ncbi:hypothetical protein Tco_0877062 [Tanacetum coccineum]|uniref:Transposase (Putative), gypsy type n=1 Tax=Tanacetum coccineum TaxID=301880 RepID=A0ABQ5BUA7_9ASTR
MSFSKRPGTDAICYTKPLDSLKNWNDRFFWVDAFACLASFPWSTSKSVPKDPYPKSSQFNTEHYATLVAYPALFRKYPKLFLCLVGIGRHYTLDENIYPEFLRDDDDEMDLLSFIWIADPTKVRIRERQRAEDEPKLLDTTVGRVVPLLPVAPARGEDELDDSVDRLFDKEGSGEVISEEVASLQPRHKKKQKTIVDTGEPLHPAKKLRINHETPGGPTVGGKGGHAPTLPFVTSFVSATSEREEGDHVDSLARANLRTIGALQRFVISSDSSHCSGTHVAETEVDSLNKFAAPAMTTATTVTETASDATVVKETITNPSLFATTLSYTDETEPTPSSFFDLTGSDLLVGDIRTIIDPDSDLQKVYVLRWSVTNGSLLDDNRICREMMTLGAEVRMRAEYNIKEKRKLKFVAEEKDILQKARDKEIESLKAQLLVKEAEAIRLRAETSKFEAVEKSLRDEIHVLKGRNIGLEKEKDELDVKVADLAASVKVREQEAADLDAMVTSVRCLNDNLVHRLEAFSAELQEKVAVYNNYMSQLEKWLLSYGMKLAVFKCLNSPEYLSAIGAAISKAIEKGMQDGLAAGITHGQEGRVLTDVATFNPFAEANFASALQEVQNVNFCLLAELRSNKDASVETVMDLLRLDEALAERVLSLSLDVSHGRVQRIKENIANNRPALHDVFVSFSEPLSIVALGGTEDTSGTTPYTTTALSTTFALAGSVPSISTDDYLIVHADDQEGTGADVNPFPSIDDAELVIPQ